MKMLSVFATVVGLMLGSSVFAQKSHGERSFLGNTLKVSLIGPDSLVMGNQKMTLKLTDPSGAPKAIPPRLISVGIEMDMGSMIMKDNVALQADRDQAGAPIVGSLSGTARFSMSGLWSVKIAIKDPANLTAPAEVQTVDLNIGQ